MKIVITFKEDIPSGSTDDYGGNTVTGSIMYKDMEKKIVSLIEFNHNYRDYSFEFKEVK